MLGLKHGLLHGLGLLGEPLSASRDRTATWVIPRRPVHRTRAVSASGVSSMRVTRIFFAMEPILSADQVSNIRACERSHSLLRMAAMHPRGLSTMWSVNWL